MPIATRRSSKYVDLVRRELLHVGHATNGELADLVRKKHPSISDTTIHRITSRLVHDGECAVGPILQSGVRRFDINLLPHDHFYCVHCDALRDIVLPDHIRQELERVLGGCNVDGQLLISGSCRKCNT